MDDCDIWAIIEVQFADIGIDTIDSYYDIAIKYYKENNKIPTIDFIMNQELDERYSDGADNSDKSNDSNDSNVSNNSDDSNDSNDSNNSDDFNDSNNSNNSDDSNNSDNEPPNSDESNEIEEQIQFISQNSETLVVKKIIKNIEEIPILMFKNVNLQNSNTECLICYDSFVPTDIIRILPCKHLFHRRCIDQELQYQSFLCPYCKNPSGNYTFLNL